MTDIPGYKTETGYYAICWTMTIYFLKIMLATKALVTGRVFLISFLFLLCIRTIKSDVVKSKEQFSNLDHISDASRLSPYKFSFIEQKANAKRRLWVRREAKFFNKIGKRIAKKEGKKIAKKHI